MQRKMVLKEWHCAGTSSGTVAVEVKADVLEKQLGALQWLD